jgi:proteasome assembly chaperone 3
LIDPSDPEHLADASLLPLAHLTPTTLLGGTVPERETLGQLYAAQIASAVAKRNPEERRMLVLGLGLVSTEMVREVFIDILGLVGDVIP